MPGSAELLQEYFVKLGYKSDLIAWHKFDNNLGATGKKILNFSTKAVGAIAAVETATAAFAYKMRDLSFKSELSNTSIKNINSMGYAAKQVGIDVDSMQSALHNMAQSFRLSPGLQSLVESMGVRVQGRDVSDVLKDYVAQLNKMPEYTAAQYAAMFGMDPDTYHMLREHLGDLEKAQEHNNDLFKQYNVDVDKAAEVSKTYAAALDDLEERFKLLAIVAMTKMLPAFKELNSFVVDDLSRITKAFQEKGGLTRMLAATNPITYGIEYARALAHPAAPQIVRNGQKYNASNYAEGKIGVTYGSDVQGVQGGGLAAPNGTLGQGRPDVPAKGVEAQRRWYMMSSLEEDYGLPRGLLHKLIQTESGGNDRATSKAGAMGPAQLMPGTAAQLGVKDPYSFDQSVPAAAGYLGKLMKKYNGNVAQVLMAYNWGEGNVDSFVKTGHGVQTKSNPQGLIPSETQAYVQKIAGQSISKTGVGVGAVTLNTTINVNGTTDPQRTATEVASRQSNVAKDLLRDTRGVEQ